MTGFTFEWWWMFAALPLPIIAYRLMPAQSSSVRVTLPHIDSASTIANRRDTVGKVLAVMAWICLVTASARPVWYDEPITVYPKHRDMMLVIDLSYSMAQEDMLFDGEYIDRLSTVKRVVSDFIQQREGDRLGLVYFADHAYLQTPLTFDHQAIETQLNQTVLKLIGTQTAIGDGIGLATKTFIDGDAPQRVMILLSDGSNNAGVLDPMEAAEIAKKNNTIIYTVGIGAGEMQVREFFMTRTVNTAEDLDERALIDIAKRTGGQYFRARNAKELSTIYDTINALQPVQQATQSWRPKTEWFFVPTFIALLLLAMTLMIRRSHV
ncbi:BatA bacteroides aerotolerance operon [Vibrio maritimus]|uniref:BatA bacteroides aerotolerance operon n=1 Tax=Vibrio maritimus TaxID=990268 RepID=A0A090RR55_9VIBR|nr:BatA bacteroides aerotolerance operon [Vibrio maritimus]